MMNNLTFAAKIAETYGMEVTVKSNGFFSAKLENNNESVNIFGYEDYLNVTVFANGVSPLKSDHNQYYELTNRTNIWITSKDPIWESWKKDLMGTLGWF